MTSEDLGSSSGGQPIAADFNGDGRTDLALVGSEINVYLGTGGGQVLPAQSVADAIRSTPLVADWTGDGVPDVIELDGRGQILFRRGQAGERGAFDPPVILNPALLPSATDLARVVTPSGPLLAALDARDAAVWLYRVAPEGALDLVARLAVPGSLPNRIVAGDLNGDGRDDLAVTCAGSDQVMIYQQGHPGVVGPMDPGRMGFGWGPDRAIDVGVSPSDLALTDANGDHRPDIVVTDLVSGDVSVLVNDPFQPFSQVLRYRSGTGAYGVDRSGQTMTVRSDEAPLSLVVGPFTGSGTGNDLVVINSNTGKLTLLPALGEGGFGTPRNLFTLPRDARPTAVVTGDFNGDGIPDLAVLETGAGLVAVHRGDGAGGFVQTATFTAGDSPSGLSVEDVNGDGKPDLVVGNAFGDVLTLLGNGDGSFRPYQKLDRGIALAVADLQGDGRDDFIFADQGLDRVSVQYGGDRTAVLGDRADGLLSPGAVKLADLNGDGIPDLIVANSGSNNVLVYPGTGDGQFAAAVNGGHGYFVGTNLVGITVADVNGDGRPDLVVADKSSNQVSILLNQSQPGGAMTFAAGPRLSARGSGPISTVVGHFTGGPNPDLLVTNSGSNNVTLLPGLGQGFFNDTSPRTFAVGASPVASFVGNFDGRTDLVTVNAASNTLTVVSGFEGPDPVVSTLASGGVDPTTAFAFAAGAGFDDLVVGHGGDGALALFEGGPEGLELVSVETEPDLPAPTALAFSALTGGAVEFYAATAGREAAELVALSQSVPIETGTGSVGEPPGAATVQLVALQETSLPLVATVLTLTITGSGEEAAPAPAEAGAPGVLATVAGPGISAGQGPLATSGGGGATSGPSEESDEADVAAPAAPAALAPWERFVLGLDAALEELGREGAGGILGPSGAADRSNPSPDPGVPAQGGGPGLRSAPGEPSDAEPDRDTSGMTGARSADNNGPHADADPGMIHDAGGLRRPNWEGAGILPGGLRESISASTRAVDAALERLAAEPAGSDAGEIDPTMIRPGADDPGLAALCLAVSWLTARRGGLRRHATRPRAPDRCMRPSVRRRLPAII